MQMDIMDLRDGADIATTLSPYVLLMYLDLQNSYGRLRDRRLAMRFCVFGDDLIWTSVTMTDPRPTFS
jgi:hypothetical protein